MRLNILFAILLVTAISGSAHAGWFSPDDFEVKQSDTRFSEDHNPTFTGQNNRISSKSIAGGTQIDSSGVYIDPTVTKDQQSGQIIFLGLVIVNRTSEDTQYGDVNSLGTPQSISFSVNGSKAIVLQIGAGDSRTSGPATYNTVGRYASVNVNESGVASLTAQQYEEIIDADSLAVKIQGSRRSVVYEANEISSSFVKNLRTFYEQYAR